jgi:hypothetical protein
MKISVKDKMILETVSVELYFKNREMMVLNRDKPTLKTLREIVPFRF